jgi:hypothetical protein
MGLFSGSNQQDNPPGARAAALVIEAEAPPQNPSLFGSNSTGIVRVLVYDGAAPRQLASRFRHSEKHWLVRGMEVQVFIDPAKPNEFEVDWDSIPSMQERADANDPTLADPIAAGKRVAMALGLTQADTGTRRQEAFTALMDRSATLPTPSGWTRAVVMVTTVRGRLSEGGSEDSSVTSITYHRSSEAVLAVNIPGRSPYAVFLPKFKYPNGKSDVSGGGLPALVSMTRPDEIDIQWDEVPSIQTQVSDRIATSSPQRIAQFGDLREQFTQMAQQAMANPPAATVISDPAAVPGMGTLPPAARQLMIDNLKRNLAYINDPSQRQMVLDQYRAMGIDISPGELS